MEVDIDYVLQNGDPRVEPLPLMDSPRKTLLLILGYLVFVKIIGPLYMRNRKPFELRKWMVFYNTALSCLSTWMFLSFGNLWIYKYNMRCPSIDYSNTPDAQKALLTFYVFYISKFLEFIDTIFFVFRKKDNQITFLHIFHHASVPLVAWYAVKYIAGGYASILPMLNSFVHIWMYLYYGMAAIGSSMQKYLWWKKHLTTLQLIQFATTMIYFAQMFAFPVKDCNVRSFPVWLSLSQAIIFFVLFSHFYIVAYISKKKASQ